MKRIRTRFSVYEVDEKNKRYRRLEGQRPPTPRQGADGEWTPYEEYYRLLDGYYFVLRYEDAVAKGTLTSTVMSEEEVADVPEG